MKIYVASKFSNRDEVRRVQGLLKLAGHEITYDWTEDDAIDVAGPCDAYKIPVDPKIARELARRDFEGVEAADALIFLPVEQGGRGCYTEMGIALALGVPVVVVGPHFNSIFMYLPNVARSVAPIENLIEYLEDIVSDCAERMPA